MGPRGFRGGAEIFEIDEKEDEPGDERPPEPAAFTGGGDAGGLESGPKIGEFVLPWMGRRHGETSGAAS